MSVCHRINRLPKQSAFVHNTIIKRVGHNTFSNFVQSNVRALVTLLDKICGRCQPLSYFNICFIFNICYSLFVKISISLRAGDNVQIIMFPSPTFFVNHRTDIKCVRTWMKGSMGNFMTNWLVTPIQYIIIWE